MKRTSAAPSSLRAVRLPGRVDRQGRVVVEQTVEAPEGEVEVILLLPELASRQPAPRRRRDVLDEPFVGMWRDRDDLADSASFVESLRRSLERRGDRG